MKNKLLNLILIIGILIPNLLNASKHKVLHTYNMSDAPIVRVTGKLTLYTKHSYQLRRGDKLKVLKVYKNILYVKVIKSHNYNTLGKSGYIGNYNTDFNIDIHKYSQKIDIKQYTLKVNAPNRAKIQILNIKPRYKDNIILKEGKYKIRVSKDGYKTYTRTIELNKNMILDIKLKKISIPKNTKLSKTPIIHKEITIIWDNENKYNLNSKHISLVNGLLWGNSMRGSNKYNYYDAKYTCSHMSYNDNGIIFNNFRLATKKEWKQSYGKKEFYSSNPMSRKYFWTSSSDDCDEIYKNRIIAIGTHSSHLEMKCIKKNLKQTFYSYNYPMWSLCITSNISQDIFEIANQILKHNINKITTIKVPKKPIKSKEKKLIKDEFETTKMFQKRIQLQKDKINNQYIQAIKNWEKQKKDIEKKHILELKKVEKTKIQLYTTAIQKAIHLKYGNPKILKVKYNADKQLFYIKLGSTRSHFNKNVQIPVKLKYAKKFKKILINKKFKPIIEFKVINNKLIFKGITQIKDPELFVEEKEYKKLLINIKYKNNNDIQKAISNLETFMTKYPKSIFKEDAKYTINTYKSEITYRETKKRLEKEREEKAAKIKEKKRQERIKRKNDSYYSKKHIGDKVCMDGRTAFILPITITAYVENVNRDRIQLRISSTDGTTPNLNGIRLYKNTLIWDNYMNWYKCNY